MLASGLPGSSFADSIGMPIRRQPGKTLERPALFAPFPAAFSDGTVTVRPLRDR